MTESTGISRRALLRGMTAVPVVACLSAAGCNTASVSPAVQAAANDVKLIGQAFVGMLPTIATLTGMTMQTTAKISQWAGDLGAFAGSLAAMPTTSGAASVVQDVERTVNAIFSALSSVKSMPASVAGVLKAAQTLMPVIQMAVGVLTAMAPAARGMTPDEARAVLAVAAAR
jgi:hypothetical protein